MSLKSLYNKYKDKLTAAQRWQCETHLLIGDFPEHIKAYFDEFSHSDVPVAPAVVHIEKSYEPLPPAVQRWHDELRQLYKERGYTHSQLRHFKTDEERREAAEKIIDYRKQIEAIFKKINKYQESGEIEQEISEAEIKKKVILAYNRRRHLLEKRSRLLKQKDYDKAELDEINKELLDIKKYLEDE